MVFCPPTVPSSLTEDVPLVRGHPQGHTVSTVIWRHHETLWGNTEDWGLSSPILTYCFSQQHSTVKIKLEITLTYVILHKGNLFRYLKEYFPLSLPFVDLIK